MANYLACTDSGVGASMWWQCATYTISFIIAFMKEVLFYLALVCLPISNYIEENYVGDLSLDKEVAIKFWKSSGSRLRNFWIFLPLWDMGNLANFADNYNWSYKQIIMKFLEAGGDVSLATKHSIWCWYGSRSWSSIFKWNFYHLVQLCHSKNFSGSVICSLRLLLLAFMFFLNSLNKNIFVCVVVVC